MEDKKLTFEEVWFLMNTLGVPCMNEGTGETDKEGIIIHDKIGDVIFTRHLGDQVLGFSVVRICTLIGQWAKAKGEYEGKQSIKRQFNALLK